MEAIISNCKNNNLTALIKAKDQKHRKERKLGFLRIIDVTDSYSVTDIQLVLNLVRVA